MRSACRLFVGVVAVLLFHVSLQATVLNLGAPVYESCGDLSINGVVLPSAGDSIVQLVWDWGDSSTTQSWFPADHHYSRNGTYTVKVTATSQAGATISQTAVVTVTSAEDPLCAYEVLVTPGTLALRDGVTTATVRVTVLGPSGEVIPVDNSAVAFTSSDTSLVQVNATGKVTATGFGEATVQAKPGAYPHSATVTVIAGHLRVEPAILVLTMTGANSGQLTVDAANANGTPLDLTKEGVQWTGGNASASVNATGLVTALQPPTLAVGPPSIGATVRGIASHNRALIRVLAGSQAVGMRRVNAPAPASTVFYLADSVGGFSPTQVFSNYDAARITDLAYGFEREASGVQPNQGDLQYLVGDVALTGDPTLPCGYSGNPVVLGSALDSLNSCLIELPSRAPAWGIFFHELGHNFTLGSRRFSDFAAAPMGSGTAPDNVKILYVEGLATGMAMYAGRALRDSAATNGIPQSTVDSILGSHLVWSHSGSTPSLDAYITAGASYNTMTPDILDDILMVLMDQYGYGFFRRFLAVFLPDDTPFPFTIQSEAQQATFFVAALSAAARTDLRGRFRTNWGFPIDDTFYAGIYQALLQYAAYVDVTPVLSIAKSHTGNFTQGQNGATYSVTVSNATGAGPTSGTATVTETVPAGLTLVSMAGTGWTCSTGGNTCARSDPLAAGASYPAITVTVNVAANAPSQVTNQVSVLGGGFATASDLTTIAPARAPYLMLWFGATPSSFSSAADIEMVRLRATITTPFTYFAALAWNSGAPGGGYCGIQDASSGGGSRCGPISSGRNYIFSLWDPPSGGESSVVYSNPSGSACHGTGEGGTVGYLNYAMPWQLGAWYRLLVRAWNYGPNTYYALWSYDESAGIWTHHATLAYPAASVFMDGAPAAFLEDWEGTGQNVRAGEYNEAWKRSLSKQWVALGEATFAVNHDVTGNGPYYNSFDAGTRNGAFWMQSGGNTTPSIEPGAEFSLPATSQVPALSVGNTLSANASYSSAASQLTVSWTSDPTVSPQFAYQVDVFDNPYWSGSPVFSQSDIAPHVRSITAKVVLPGTTYFVRVTTADIFDQLAAPVGTALSMLTVSTASMTFNATVGGNVPASQNLVVSVPSSTTFTANTSEQSCTNSNWLTISPSGSVTATGTTTNIQVSVNQSGIAAGITCTGAILLVAAGSSQTVNVTMMVAAQVIYTSFGASPGFSSNGSCVSGPNNTSCGPGATRWIAGSFTAGGTFTLSSIALAVTNIGGTNGAVILLANNGPGGSPGTTVMEQWTVSNLPNWGRPSITSVTSKLNPTLYTGQTYWVIAEGLAGDSMDYWFTNNLDLGGGKSNLNQGGWTPTTQPQPAFEILGSPAGLSNPPVLSIAKSHTGNFTQGQNGATYSVTVSAGATSGTVTVTETVPAGMTLVSMAGTGWTCSTGGNTCTRSDPLAAGASYPAVTVTVNVAPNAPSQVTNLVSVLGGGSATNASDLTNIMAPLPVVPSGSVVNGASFAPSQAVAPGSLVSIFGTNLASSTAQAGSIPLSTSLANVSVAFNGIPAPLVAVDHLSTYDQINAQLPWNVVPGGAQSGTAQVVVTRGGAASVATSFQVVASAPGIFSLAGTGTGQARAINNSDGTFAAPSGSVPGFTTHPAKIGDPNGIAIFATGLGAVSPPVANGGIPASGLSNAVTTPTVLAGNVPAQVIFAGMSPQYVGLNQINIVLAPGTPTGNAVPLQLQVGGIMSTNQLTIAVSQ
jgi:uncharacterized protein (TIGR03437 family)